MRLLAFFLILAPLNPAMATPSWAEGANCRLCKHLETLEKKMSIARKTPDKVARTEATSQVIFDAGNSLIERLKKSEKFPLSTNEIDAILKFVADTADEDVMHSMVEQIYGTTKVKGDYVKRKALYEQRLKNLDEASRKKVMDQIHAYETSLTSPDRG